MDFFIAHNPLVSNAKAQKVFQSLDKKDNATHVHLRRAQTQYRERTHFFPKRFQNAVKNKMIFFLRARDQLCPGRVDSAHTV